MKTVLAALVALIGLGAPAVAEPQPRMMDPAAIGYSMSTLAADAPRMDPLKTIPTSTLAFHEDEWRQIEFYPGDRIDEIQRTLIALKGFAAEHRKGQGWSDVYLRRLAPRPVMSGPTALSDLERTLALTAETAPAMFHGDDVVIGRITDGFSLAVGRGVWMYGVRDRGGVSVLGALVDTGGDDLSLVRAFVTLNKAYGLILVDWRSQQLYLSVADNGQIVAWSP